MLNAIEAGRIFVKEGTALPKTLQIESEPYVPGWRSVKSLDGYGLGRKIHDAGWTFFCLAKHFELAVPSEIELRPDQSIGLSPSKEMSLDETKTPNLESVRI